MYAILVSAPSPNPSFLLSTIKTTKIRAERQNNLMRLHKRALLWVAAVSPG